MNKRIEKVVRSSIKKTLDLILKTEANTVSCAIMYEPKQPDDLKKLRRKK